MSRKSRKKEIVPVNKDNLTSCEINITDDYKGETGSEEQLETAAYIRLSVENNGNETEDSLLTQISMVEGYINDQSDLKLKETYVDNGYSGTKFDRPEFVRMIDDVKKGDIQCIVVKDLSRFGRDYLETGYYIETIFPLLHIRFIAITDNFDSFRKADRDNISVPIKNMVNEMYAKDYSKKQETFREMCKKTGRVMSYNVPYGYRLSKESGRLVINPETEPYVRMIFLWGLAGVSFAEIARRLNFIGAPTRSESEGWKLTAKKWEGAIVKYILYNPAYAGFHVMGKTKVSLYKGIQPTRTNRDEWIFFPDYHEAYITMDDYEKLNELREEREISFHDKLKPRENARMQLTDCFSQMVYCGDCGRKMDFYRGTHSRVNEQLTFQYYRCRYKTGEEGCGHKKIQQNLLKIVVMDQIRMLIQTACDKDRILQKIESGKVKSSSLERAKRNCLRLEKKIKDIDEKVIQSYVDYADGILDEDDYIYIKKKLTNEKELIIGKKEEADKKMANIELAIENFHQLTEHLKEYLNVTEFNEKLVEELVEKIWVYDSGNRIEVEFKCHDVFDDVLITEILKGDTKNGNGNLS